MMGLKWTVLLFVGALLSCGSCVDWMGGGNFTQENLTTIMEKIQGFDGQSSKAAFAPYADFVSNELNDIWAQAWNVVIVWASDGKNYDAVLYGYPFRGHWFWYNGRQVGLGYLSFIIWKDYNCARWITINPAAVGYLPSSFGGDTAAISTTIMSAYFQRDVADIWKVAQDVQAKVPTTNAGIFQDKLAFTVIASQSSTSSFFAKVCARDYIAISGVGINAGAPSGAALVLQMRGTSSH